MSVSRFMFPLFSSLAASGMVSGLYGATRWKIATCTQTGVINNTSEQGLFIKTNEMYLQRSEVADGNPLNDMHMSLHKDPELIAKAQKYCEQGSFVKVNYDRFFIANPLLGSSTRKVKDIEEVTRDSAHTNERQTCRMK